jgi:hypothetical protein
MPLTLTAPVATFSQVHGLVTSGLILLLRGFNHPLLPPGTYLLAGDVKTQIIGYQDAYVRWDMQCQVVAPPAPVIGVPWLTLDDVVEALPGLGLPVDATIDEVSDAAEAAGVTVASAPAWFEAALARVRGA